MLALRLMVSRQLQVDTPTYRHPPGSASEPEVVFYGEGGPTDEMILKIKYIAEIFGLRFPLFYPRTRWRILSPPAIHVWPVAAAHNDFCLMYMAVCGCDWDDRVKWSSASPASEVQTSWEKHMLDVRNLGLSVGCICLQTSASLEGNSSSWPRATTHARTIPWCFGIQRLFYA
jgi:hypothetical protein